MEGPTSYLDLLPPELRYQISRIIKGQPFEFQELPDYLRKHVAVFIRYKDLMGLCEVSDEVREEICGDDFFWKAKLNEDFGRRYPEYIPKESGNWRSEYEDYRILAGLDMIKAAEAGEIGRVKDFIDTGAIDIDLKDRGGNTALIGSSRSLSVVDSEIAKLLLEYGADVNARNDKGVTALIWASKEGKEDTVKVLLENGAVPNIQTEGIWEDGRRIFVAGRTALMMAARNGNLNIVQGLLEEGADPNIEDTKGNTALIEASIEENPEIIRELLRVGADVNAQNDDFKHSALDLASYYGNILVVRELLEAGAILDVQNDYGVTPLISATDMGEMGTIQLLLEAGANPNIQDENGNTALDIARSNENEVLADLIESYS